MGSLEKNHPSCGLCRRDMRLWTDLYAGIRMDGMAAILDANWHRSVVHLFRHQESTSCRGGGGLHLRRVEFGADHVPISTMIDGPDEDTDRCTEILSVEQQEIKLIYRVVGAYRNGHYVPRREFDAAILKAIARWHKGGDAVNLSG